MKSHLKMAVLGLIGIAVISGPALAKSPVMLPKLPAPKFPLPNFPVPSPKPLPLPPPKLLPLPPLPLPKPPFPFPPPKLPPLPPFPLPKPPLPFPPPKLPPLPPLPPLPKPPIPPKPPVPPTPPTPAPPPVVVSPPPVDVPPVVISPPVITQPPVVVSSPPAVMPPDLLPPIDNVILPSASEVKSAAALPWQSKKFLQVRNGTGEELRVFVIYLTEDQSGQAVWAPLAATGSSDPVSYVLKPGDDRVLALPDTGKMLTSRVRIWAASASKSWIDFQQKDLVLVDQPYQAAEPQVFKQSFGN
ncbi:MAG: hypothetical protein ACJ8F7_02185 [Gemmataceae bacterium]